MIELPIECKSTRHFYNLVRILNQQIGRGSWTTQGRPVRKLRRLDKMNHLGLLHTTQTVVFKIPTVHDNISTALTLWSE